MLTCKMEMEGREEINRLLREKAHEELDQARILLNSVSDSFFREAAEFKLIELSKWVEDRSRRVRTESLKKIIIAATLLIERMNTKLSIENGTNTESNPAVEGEVLSTTNSVSDMSKLQTSRERMHASITHESSMIRPIPLFEQKAICDVKTTEKLVAKDIYEMANSYDAMKSDSPSSKELAVQPTDRLAMKYPRKKNGSLNDSDVFKIPTIPHKRPSSPLFHRRHEIFNSSEPVAYTYGEHKRQRLEKEKLESQRLLFGDHTEIMNPTRKPSSLDPRIAHYASLGKPVLSVHVADRSQLDLKNNNNEIPLTPTVVDTKVATKNGAVQKAQLVRSNEDIGKTEVDVLQSSQKSSGDIKQMAITEGQTHNLTVAITTETGNRDGGPMTTLHFEGKHDMEIPESSSTSDTPQMSNTSSGDVHKPSESAKSAKPINKSVKPIRELNDLLSYTSEFMANYSRREMKDQLSSQQKSDQILLQQFGIKKNVRVVLQKTIVERSVTPPPTQSKEAAFSKKSAHEMKMKRRKSVCFDTRKHSSISDDVSPMKTRKQLSKELAKHPNTVELPSQKLGNNMEPNIKKKTKSNATTSHKRNQSSLLDDRTKNKKGGSSQKMAVKRPASKKQRCDRVQQSDEMILQVATKVAKTTNALSPMRDSPATDAIIGVSTEEDFWYNNNPEVHCHSKYMTECNLCDFKDVLQAEIVSHYVYEHPASDVIISRVTPEQAKVIKQNPMLTDGKRIVSRYGSKSISFRCHFCEMRTTLKKEHWIQHLVNHTGEYRFRCRACPAMARTSEEPVIHEEICGKREMIVYNNITFEDNHLYGYMCEMCNYVQIRRFNMDRHLKREHPFQNAPCIRFSLVNYEVEPEQVSNGICSSLVKLEPVEQEDCCNLMGALVKLEQNDKAEQDSLPFPSRMLCDPEKTIFSSFIEKQEHSLTNLAEENERTRFCDQPSLLNDCDDSNDSNCTLPMTSNDMEDSDKGTDGAQNTQGFGQRIFEKIKNENMLHKTKEGGVTSLAKEVQKQPNAERITGRSKVSTAEDTPDDSEWHIVANAKNNNITIKKKTVPVSGSHSMDCERTAQNSCGPLVRLRHLPGDSLSGRLREEHDMAYMATHHETNVTSVMSGADAAPPSLSRAACSLTNSNPMNDEDGPILKIKYPLKVLVKPWIEDKSSSHHLKEITYKCLGSFYKCMGDGCGYYTDDSEQMKQHLNGHMNNGKRNLKKHEMTWLECCYCQYFATNIHCWLSHLNSDHKYCAYQCNRCFYRSREVSSAIIHQSSYHGDNESYNMILECSKQYKKFCLADQDTIIHKMNTTVKQLKCTACMSKKYFDLLEYKTHLLTHKDEFISCCLCHKLIQTSAMLKHMKSHQIFLYQCVYCVYGTDQKYVMKHHVSREHPANVCCYHIREVKKSSSANMTPVSIPLRPFVRIEETISNNRLRMYS